MRRPIGPCWFAIAIVASACTASAPQGPPPVDHWLDTLAQIADAQCARAVRCTDDRLHLYRDDVCRPPELDEPFLRRVLSRGEWRLAEDAAAECLEALRADTPCWYTRWDARTPGESYRSGSTWPRECTYLLRPGRARGESCWADAVSTNPIWISRSCAEGDCVAGASCGATCLPFGQSGSDCSDVPCAMGLHCDAATSTCVLGCTDSNECQVWPDGALCGVDGRCVEVHDLPGPGEPCFLSVDDAPACRHDAVCRADGVCGPLVPLGGACDIATSACDGGGVCDATTSTCVLVCGGVPCPIDSPYCGATDACTADPTEIACHGLDGWYDDDGCPTGFGCRGSPLHCMRMSPLGARCDDSVVCVPGATCRNGFCVRRVTPSEPCGSDAICPSEFECVDGACVYRGRGAFVPLGWACDAMTSCSYGQCIDGTCAWPAPGAACASSFECAAGCDAGACLASHVAHDGAPCDPLTGGRVCDTGLACVPATYSDAVTIDAIAWVCRAPC